MVTGSLLPVSFVEQPSFKRLINACQSGVALPTRYSITTDLENSRENSIAAVKEAMSKIEWIATTTDCWSYLGVTAHCINPDNFERESAVLACRRLTGSHTYQLLAEQLKSVHIDYGINSKVTKTTTDNGSNFVKAFTVFAPSEDELDTSTTEVENILSTEEDDLELLAHQRCAAHSLNLVSTSDAAAAESNGQYKKMSRTTFSKCQALWNKVGRAVQSKEIVDQDSPLQVIRPCSTRWNPVFDAVQRLNRISKSSPPGSQKQHMPAA